MAAGLGLLGLSPQEFWGMTPKELEAALRGRLGPSVFDMPISRGELSRLMTAFPDQT